MKITTVKWMTVVGVLLASGIAQATVIFSDDFSDGNRDGWYKWAGINDAQTALSVSEGALVVNNSGNGSRQIETTFSSTTLSVGQKLTASFDIRLDNIVNSANTMRFGLFNNGGTALSADTALFTTDPTNNDNSGYWVAVDSRTSGATGTAIIYNDTVAALAWNNSSPTVTFTSQSAVGILTNSFQTVSFSVERTADSEYTIGIQIGAGPLKTVVHSSGGEFVSTFNTLAIYQNAFTGGADYTIDNVSVSVIPEPATIGMLSLGGFGILLLRRMQKSR